ncbi:hypothetical protein BZA77DRAFT_110080 [Pyronema omphalodes]|nr:hypothetical protein BZA77DRAFT_110080 [Pyronema omphalodes]
MKQFPRRRITLILLLILIFLYIRSLSKSGKSNSPTTTTTTSSRTSHHKPATPEINHESTIESALNHYGFIRGISTFQPDGLSKHLVIPRTNTDDTTWTTLLPSWLNMTTKIYQIPSAQYTAPFPPGTLTIPVNKGNEAMTYLTYIISHYDILPDIVIFIHAGLQQWHNNPLQMFSTPVMLREFNYQRARKRGFVNLRCQSDPGCPDWIQPARVKKPDSRKMEEWFIARAWGELFPGGAKVPEILAAPCCAQFVVTKEAIWRHRKEDYQRWQRWLMWTELDSKYSGRVWEYLWHYVFGRGEVDCPLEAVCYCDGFGVCFEGDGLREHLRLGLQAVGKESTLKVMRKEGLKKGEDRETREKVMELLENELEDLTRKLGEQIEVARERGRDPELRRRELPEGEFSG